MTQHTEFEKKELEKSRNICLKWIQSLKMRTSKLFSYQFIYIFEQIIDWDSFHLLFICTAFVFLYSFLPHKETRFIFFIIPPMTLLSTIGVLRLWNLWCLPLSMRIESIATQQKQQQQQSRQTSPHKSRHHRKRRNSNVSNLNNSGNSTDSSLDEIELIQDWKTSTLIHFDRIMQDCDNLSVSNSQFYWLKVDSANSYPFLSMLLKFLKKWKRNGSKMIKFVSNTLNSLANQYKLFKKSDEKISNTTTNNNNVTTSSVTPVTTTSSSSITALDMFGKTSKNRFKSHSKQSKSSKHSNSNSLDEKQKAKQQKTQQTQGQKTKSKGLVEKCYLCLFGIIFGWQESSSSTNDPNIGIISNTTTNTSNNSSNNNTIKSIARVENFVDDECCSYSKGFIWFQNVVQFVICSLCLISFILSIDRVYVSRFNYFGGYAIRALPSIIMYDYLQSVNVTHPRINSAKEQPKYYLTKHLFDGVNQLEMKKYLDSFNGTNGKKEMETNVYKMFNKLNEMEYFMWHEKDWNLERYLLQKSNEYRASMRPPPHIFEPKPSRLIPDPMNNDKNKKDGIMKKAGANSKRSSKNKNEKLKNSQDSRIGRKQYSKNAKRHKRKLFASTDSNSKENEKDLFFSQQQALRSRNFADKVNNEEIKLNMEGLYSNGKNTGSSSIKKDTGAVATDHKNTDLKMGPNRVNDVKHIESLMDAYNDVGSVLESMPVSCIHIGNSAAISGVTLYMTPKYNPYFYFSKLEELGKEDYATVIDPCRIKSVSTVPYLSPKHKRQRKDLIHQHMKLQHKFFEEDLEDMSKDKGDDDGSWNSNNNNNLRNKNGKIGNEMKYERKERVGFDYLISEYNDIPGYKVIDYGGIIYGLAQRSFWKLFQVPLEPKLYILKKE